MQSFSEELDRLLTGLAWSLWTEVGVAGVERNHEHHAIDPEPLILMTAALRDADPRLRDESIDWCVRYFTFISKARLRNLLKSQDRATRKAFGDYAATVNANAPAKWPVPAGVKPRPFTASGKSSAEFPRPALVRLRMRALFGVGARAELLSTFLGEPSTSKSASELAAVGFAKRNVAQVLSELQMAGLFHAIPVRNRLYYRLARVDALRTLADPLPRYFLDWGTLLTFLAAAHHLAVRSERTSLRVSAVGLNRLLQRFSWSLHSVYEPLPRPQVDLGEYWEKASHWILRFTRDLSEGRVPRRSPSS